MWMLMVDVRKACIYVRSEFNSLICFRFLPFTLAGSGSDEQLGGYSRHRSRFENDGYEGLAAELRMEMCRIGRRNFGRDDRVTSSNGRPALYVTSEPSRPSCMRRDNE